MGNDEGKDKELLFSITKEDFEIETFRCGGKGGQHQNKTESGVRIRHRESGAIGESREERSQHQNKRIALKRLTLHPAFKKWHKLKCAAAFMGMNDIKKMLNQMVDEQLQEKNIKYEIKDENGNWIEIKEEDIK
jgi:protein subunit release factor B